MSRPRIEPHANRHERGAILITGLVLLVMVMLLGMAAMRTTTLQERLSGASVDYNGAFQNAETALRAGEKAIGTGAYIYRLNGNPDAPAVSVLASGTEGWDSIADKQTRVGIYNTGGTRKPRYIIEWQYSIGGGSGGDKVSLKAGATPNGLVSGGNVYKVTALGQGLQTQGNYSVTDVVLQSTVIR
jgi:type IV pilus assembly protein PilX